MIMNKNDKAHNYERRVTYYEISDGRKLLWMVSRKDYEGIVPLEHIKDEIKERILSSMKSKKNYVLWFCSW